MKKQTLQSILQGLLLCIVIALCAAGCTPEDPSASEGDFVIEDGVLLSYGGGDAEVVLPKEVKLISEGAFRDVPGEQIRKITFSEELFHVDAKAFAPLITLETIVIPESNPNFFFEDGILGKGDGSAYWVMTALPESANAYIAERDSQSQTEKGLLLTVHKLQQGKLPFYRNPVLAVGSAVFELDVKRNEEGNEVSLISVSAYGQKLEAEITPFRQIEGNFYFDILEYDDRLIFTQQVQTQRVLAVLCSEGLHYEEVDPKVVDNGTGKPPADLCSLLNTFYLEKGQLRYLREPAKFVHNRTQVAGVRMQYCVSRQEFFLEEGRVSFDGAVPVLHMESRKTVSEGMDLEAEFQLWKQTLPDIVTGTLDEYLAEQAQKYEEARPE
ncbi:MAG: hypothetical protein E7223_00675 [Clostridiales bacterium]|nr:hypothetical protein [Clostridiales bacterium]